MAKRKKMDKASRPASYKADTEFAKENVPEMEKREQKSKRNEEE